MSSQTCHQGSEGIQTLYQTKAKTKRETSRLSERDDHQPTENNLDYREPPLFKAA
jgi:hypothetical protein